MSRIDVWLWSIYFNVHIPFLVPWINAQQQGEGHYISDPSPYLLDSWPGRLLDRKIDPA